MVVQAATPFAQLAEEIEKSFSWKRSCCRQLPLEQVCGVEPVKLLPHCLNLLCRLAEGLELSDGLTLGEGPAIDLELHPVSLDRDLSDRRPAW